MSLGFLIRRLLGALPLLLGISLILFAIIHLAPGGPLDVYADNPSVSKEALEQITKSFGLDRPVPVQYVLWLKAMATGDWGLSIRTGRPVFAEIIGRLGPTLQLGGLAMLVSLIIALPLGTLSAVRRGSRMDSILTFLSFAGISLPVFWSALLLQLMFSVWLGWLPSAGLQSIGDGSFSDRLVHILMPVTVLSLATIASWSRYIRSGMVDVLAQDYIRTAYAKGRRETGVVILHALRNAMIPAVTVIAIDFVTIISGAVITETVFAWPGIGRLFIESMNGRDYPMLMGLMMLGSAGVVLANIIADLVYAMLDPEGSVMVDVTAVTPHEAARNPYRQMVRRFMRHRLAVCGLGFLVLMGLIVVIAPYFLPYAYDAQDFNFIGMPSQMSAAHWLGTDELGRDALTRLIYGGRVSLGVGLLGAVISTLVGTLIGAIAGFYRGIPDVLLMRFTDIMLSIPTLPLVLLLSTLFRPSPVLLIIVVGGLIWMGTARLVRAQFLALREREYIEAARALGAGGARLMFRHILPNAVGPITVAATLAVGQSIMLESGLSFLGFGILPPVPTWGNILNSASSWLAVAPWLAIPPGLCIFCTVLAVNFVGEGLRDAMEPRG